MTQPVKFILGIDLDGCLADFTTAYIRLLQRISGVTCTLKEGEEAPCWHFEEQVGFSSGHVAAAWQEIKQSRHFWETLAPYPETHPALHVLVMAMAEGHEVYFMTNRPGRSAHTQTVQWLLRLGIRFPQVLICPEIDLGDDRGKVSSKGIIAKGLGITHLIDDKIENCYAVLVDSPKTKVFVRDRRWNRKEHAALIDGGAQVVPTLQEFFEIMGADEEKANVVTH